MEPTRTSWAQGKQIEFQFPLIEILWVCTLIIDLIEEGPSRQESRSFSQLPFSPKLSLRRLFFSPNYANILECCAPFISPKHKWIRTENTWLQTPTPLASRSRAQKSPTLTSKEPDPI